MCAVRFILSAVELHGYIICSLPALVKMKFVNFSCTSKSMKRSDPEMTFGEKVKESRTKHNLSQVELAKLVGKSRRTVIDWECDRALPRTRGV